MLNSILVKKEEIMNPDLMINEKELISHNKYTNANEYLANLFNLAYAVIFFYNII